MLNCEVFAVYVLVLTAIWVYFGRTWDFHTLALAMFFPALLSIHFANDGFFNIVIGKSQGWQSTFQWSVLAGLLSFGIIIGAVAVSWIFGWGVLDERAEIDMSVHSGIFPGFIRAAGEEIGWRCYLLPCLLENYSTFYALLLSGLIWGLYHVPVMILLTHKLDPPRPLLTILVQFMSITLAAFPHGFVAIKSGFSMWAPTMMHFTWNRINPVILGSIYTQTPGKVQGEQWLINGEGLAGCVVQLPIAAFLFWKL